MRPCECDPVPRTKIEALYSTTRRRPVSLRWASQKGEVLPEWQIHALGGAYTIYRGVRMLRSLFRPLWPTIAAASAIP